MPSSLSFLGNTYVYSKLLKVINLVKENLIFPDFISSYPQFLITYVTGFNPKTKKRDMDGVFSSCILSVL